MADSFPNPMDQNGWLEYFYELCKAYCRSFTHSRSLRSSEGPGNSFAVSSSSRSTNGFVRWYLEIMDKYPILTKSITAAAIYTSVDLTSQVITFAASDVSMVSDKLEFDKLRTLRMAGYGLILSGQTLHLWFNLLSKTIPKRDLISTAKKSGSWEDCICSCYYGCLLFGEYYIF